MSIRKDTSTIPDSRIWKPTEKKTDNSKLNHVYHKISTLHDELQKVAPRQYEQTSKYDLVCRNIDEILLLLAYRNKQSELMENKTKKLQKIVNNFFK
jgi:hypothetical protein